MVANGIVWGWLDPQDSWATLAGVVLGLWFIGLGIHFIQFLWTEAQERAIEKAIERERAWRRSMGEMQEGDIKHKRDRLTLNHDGELMEVVEDEMSLTKRR